MKNPFHKFTTSGGKKTDINLNYVVSFYATDSGKTELVFADGDTLVIEESTTTVRNRTKKTWPDQTTTTDIIVDNDAAQA